MNALRTHWHLDPEVIFLNHGSFGACPKAALAEQARLRAALERQPVRFYLRELESLRQAARARIAAFVDADPASLAEVANATAGVNTVLRSLRFEPGDELLVTDHEYKACRRALTFVARRWGARVVVAPIPFPIDGPDTVVEAICSRVTPRTRLALVDHVTSQTGLVLPIARIVRRLEALGVDTLVDGAHAPGMLDVSLRSLRPAWYTANLHKWCCGPKSAAFLYARADKRTDLHPLSISHGYQPGGDFEAEFMWTGTHDPTPWLSVPTALDTLEGLVDGGWPAIRAQNHALALAGRRVVADALGVDLPCPDSMIGSMASLFLPDSTTPLADTVLPLDATQTHLWDAHRIEVPIVPWPAWPKRLMRISAQIYNDRSDFERLAAALRARLA